MNKLLIAIGLCACASPANANAISTDVLIAPSGQSGSAHLLPFAVTTAGNFDIDALGAASLGTGFSSDPMIHLFSDDGSLDALDLLATDDDGGVGTESHIDINLALGNYILAVSEWSFLLDDAILGINSSVQFPNTLIRATISSQDGVAQFAGVPEVASITLLGLGLLGIGVFGRKNRVRTIKVGGRNPFVMD